MRFLERFFNDSFIDANGTFSAFFWLEPTKTLLPTFFYELYMFLYRAPQGLLLNFAFAIWFFLLSRKVFHFLWIFFWFFWWNLPLICVILFFTRVCLLSVLGPSTLLKHILAYSCTVFYYIYFTLSCRMLFKLFALFAWHLIK